MSDPRGLTPEGRNHLVDALTQQAHRPNPFLADQVVIRCRIQVNGETITTQQSVAAVAWQSPEVRESVTQHVRQQCALEVVKRFPPKVEIIT